MLVTNASTLTPLQNMPYPPVLTHAPNNPNAQIKECEGSDQCMGMTGIPSEVWVRLRRIIGTVSFPPLANGTRADRSFSSKGISSSETLFPRWPTDLAPGLIGLVYISSSGTVTARLCNLSGQAVTPGTITLTADVTNGTASPVRLAKAEH